MGVSQLKSRLECEAAVEAGHKKTSKAFAMGSYVDEALVPRSNTAFDGYVDRNEDLIWGSTGRFYKRGEQKGMEKPKKADYQLCDRMIARVRSEPTMMEYLSGKPQVIVVGTIGGVEFKGMVDALDLNNKRLVDLKTTRSIDEPMWVERFASKGPFYEVFDYWMQLAIYQELVRQTFSVECTPYIVAVSKEDPPDIGLFAFTDQDRLDAELELVERMLPPVMATKRGETEPRKCGSCAYCRSVRVAQVTPAINMEMIG